MRSTYIEIDQKTAALLEIFRSESLGGLQIRINIGNFILAEHTVKVRHLVGFTIEYRL